MQEVTLEEALELYEQGVTWLINDGQCSLSKENAPACGNRTRSTNK